MVKNLDETDLEILAELDLNARAASSKIGDKLNLSKTTVNKRIKNLEEEGTIVDYFAQIDMLKLGFFSYNIYLKLQYVSTKTEKEIMDFISNSPFASFVSYAKGRFDLAGIFYFKNPEQLNELWNQLQEKFKPNIKESAVIPNYGGIQTRLPFTKQLHKTDHVMFKTIDPIKISKKEKAILNILSSNARVPLYKIAKVTGITSGAVKYNINQLIEKKIILAFRTVFNMEEKLGYTNYKLDINLHSIKNKEKIEQYLLNNINVTNLSRNVGWADIEMKAYVKKPDELYAIIDGLRDEFSDDFQDYDFFAFPKVVRKLINPYFGPLS
jgi:DNA-binding Lrp family transcriptional regulator